MEEALLCNCPATAYYIPNFITDKEETYLINEVYKAPRTKWTVLSNRKLQNWGGTPHPKGMLQEPLPKWLNNYCDKVTKLGIFGDSIPNHVLVNEYKPGQGIMPHTDGPLYYPTVSTISLGSHTVLEFYEDDKNVGVRESKFGFCLERRSLLVLQDSMYKNYMHGIAEVTSDNLKKEYVKNFEKLGDPILREELQHQSKELQRETRVSLTIRNVPKTLKFKLQIGKFSR